MQQPSHALFSQVFSQIKQRHSTSCPLRISQGVCVRNTIGCTLGDFFFTIFAAIAGWLICNFFQSLSHYSWQYITRAVSHCLWPTRIFAVSFTLGDIALKYLWKFNTASIIFIDIESLCCYRSGGNIDGI